MKINLIDKYDEIHLINQMYFAFYRMYSLDKLKKTTGKKFFTIWKIMYCINTSDVLILN